MVDADRKAFVAALTAVYALYRVDVSEGVVGIWWSALKPYDLASVQDAFGRHAVNPDTGQFIPKPADVVKMLKGSTLDTALAAWAKVDKAVKHIGTYSSVAFDDALIHRVLDEMGGWIQLGRVTEKELPFKQKEFENRYRAYKARSETPEYTPVLYGISDGENMNRGYRLGPVVLIGDQEKAKTVLEGGTNQPLIQMKPATEMLRIGEPA